MRIATEFVDFFEPQSNPQTMMSCATSANFGSPRGLVSCGIKIDVSYRRDVAEACGVGFDVPANLGAIEPIEPKLQPTATAVSA